MVGGYPLSFSRNALRQRALGMAPEIATCGFAGAGQRGPDLPAEKDPLSRRFGGSKGAFREKLSGYPPTISRNGGFRCAESDDARRRGPFERLFEPASPPAANAIAVAGLSRGRSQEPLGDAVPDVLGDALAELATL